MKFFVTDRFRASSLLFTGGTATILQLSEPSFILSLNSLIVIIAHVIAVYWIAQTVAKIVIRQSSLLYIPILAAAFAMWTTAVYFSASQKLLPYGLVLALNTIPLTIVTSAVFAVSGRFSLPTLAFDSSSHSEPKNAPNRLDSKIEN